MRITKRTALKSIATGGAVIAFSGLVPGIQAFAATAVRVRRGVNTMALNDPDLETYRDFVGLMRDRPASNPVSWIGFANQHGDENNFKYCPHGDWYFLPWHRAFVAMYENAAAVLTKNSKFAMPYWDWTTLRQLPAAFTDKLYKGKPNPLYVPGLGDDPTMLRNQLTGPNALTDALVGPKVVQRVYKETVYEAFGTSRNPSQNNLDMHWVSMGGGNQGPLEATPHNNVHNNIGAFMPQSNSPRDPIFMMHHGNIDRIWAHWNALGRKNSTDPLWLNMRFTNNFLSPTGQPYTKIVKDLLSTQAMGYRYDDQPSVAPLKANLLRDRNLSALLHPLGPVQLTHASAANTLSAKFTEALGLSVPLDVGTLKSIASGPPAGQPQEVVAVLHDIKVGDNVRAIRVFVNRDTVDQSVPDSDPHFVTTISFLRHKGGEDHAGHKSAPSTLVNLTETLQNLSKALALPSDKITVQLLPVPEPGVAPGAVGEVTPASIEIAFI